MQSFRYGAPAGIPQTLRYEASALVDGQTEHMVGYFLLGTPSVNAQVLSLGEQEPPELLPVVLSVRRFAASGVAGAGRWDTVIRVATYAFEAGIICLALWYLDKRRRRLTTLFAKRGSLRDQ